METIPNLDITLAIPIAYKVRQKPGTKKGNLHNKINIKYTNRFWELPPVFLLFFFTILFFESDLKDLS